MFPSRTDADARRLCLAILLSVAFYALIAGTLALLASLGVSGAAASRRDPRFASVSLSLARRDAGSGQAAGKPLSAGEVTADADETTVERVAGELPTGAGNDPSAGGDHGAGTEAVGPEGGLVAGARAFHDLLAARVRDRLAYPAVARRRGEEGSVLIDLSVKADGSLESVRVSSGSGSAVLDRAALDLVRSLFPFDPPPGGDYTIPLRIQYLLR